MDNGQNPIAPPSSSAVTELLVAWGGGDDSALEQLMPLVHAELYRLARREMRGEREGHTLQTTALVNEAYLRLVKLTGVTWNDRVHFFAMSARLMRRILVDYARSRLYLKRGGGAARLAFDEGLTIGSQPGPDLVALDEALQALAVLDPRKSQVVELRFFGGLSVDETAATLKVSSGTVMRDWRLAKAWLLKQLDGRH
jgi:RNA polymerase sigma factor (TIGR02999 family)